MTHIIKRFFPPKYESDMCSTINVLLFPLHMKDNLTSIELLNHNAFSSNSAQMNLLSSRIWHWESKAGLVLVPLWLTFFFAPCFYSFRILSSTVILENKITTNDISHSLSFIFLVYKFNLSICRVGFPWSGNSSAFLPLFIHLLYVAGRMMPPSKLRDVHTLIPGICDYLCHMARETSQI